MLQFGDMGVQGGRHEGGHEGGHRDKVADMVAEMEVNKVTEMVANMKVDKVADMVADMVAVILQFGERVGHDGGWLIGPKLFPDEPYLACASFMFLLVY